MTLEELTSKASKALESGADFDRRLKLDFGEDGLVFVDGASRRVSNEDAPADATLSMSYDDFKLIASGRLDPMKAYFQQKLKISGDMGVVMRIQSLLKSMQ